MLNVDPIRNAIAPYALLIKVGLVLAVLLAAFAGGCSVQKRFDAGELAKKDTALAKAAGDLRLTQKALDAAATVLTEVNAETERQVKAADKRAKDAERAKRIAQAAADRLKRRQQTFEAAVVDARRDAACNALLNTDLQEVCGL